ncbi:uncharacterized protein LOC144120912 isoform X2 [Amblyomma americanum]
MNLRTKRRITLCTACCFFLIAGIEYALIFPSLCKYVTHRFKPPDYVIAVVISACSLTGLFVSPFVGMWADATRNVRSVLLVVNLGAVVGNLLYFTGISHWLLLIARLLSGLGAGTAAVILADVARSTVEKDRTAMFALLAGFRELGIVVGSSFNVTLRKMDLSTVPKVVGVHPLDGYSFSTLLMAFLWLAMEAGFFWAYFNLAELCHQQRLEDTLQCSYLEASMGNVSECVPPPSPLPPRSDQADSISYAGEVTAPHRHTHPMLQPPLMGSLNSDLAKMHRSPLNLSMDEGDLFSDVMIETAERFILSSESAHPNAALRGAFGAPPSISDFEQSATHSASENARSESVVPETQVLHRYCSEYIREDTVVLLAIAFLVTYSQTALQFALYPIANDVYGYTEDKSVAISIVCGVEVLLVFAGVHILSRQLSDRLLLLVGLVFTCAGTFLWLGFSFIPKPEPNSLPLFVLGTAVALFGMPMLTVCTSSLISKVTNSKHQAVMLSLFMGVMQLGSTLGPLWAEGSMEHRSLLFGVPCGLSILFTVLFLASFPQLGQQCTTNENGAEVEEGQCEPSKQRTNEQLQDTSFLNGVIAVFCCFRSNGSTSREK